MEERILEAMSMRKLLPVFVELLKPENLVNEQLLVVVAKPLALGHEPGQVAVDHVCGLEGRLRPIEQLLRAELSTKERRHHPPIEWGFSARQVGITFARCGDGVADTHTPTDPVVRTSHDGKQRSTSSVIGDLARRCAVPSRQDVGTSATHHAGSAILTDVNRDRLHRITSFEAESIAG